MQKLAGGFIPTFHANYKLLSCPIDLLFNSKDFFVDELKTLKNIGSDHLPLFCSFHIDRLNTQRDVTEKLNEKEEVEVIIEEGKKRKAIEISPAFCLIYCSVDFPGGELKISQT